RRGACRTCSSSGCCANCSAFAATRQRTDECACPGTATDEAGITLALAAHSFAREAGGHNVRLAVNGYTAHAKPGLCGSGKAAGSLNTAHYEPSRGTSWNDDLAIGGNVARDGSADRLTELGVFGADALIDGYVDGSACRNRRASARESR